jgi:antitoxin HicB
VSPEIARQVEEIMARPYRKVISGDAEEGFLIEVPDLPGCMTAGDTMAEAVELLPDAMAGWLESVLLRGLPVPEPTPEPEYSGKLLVRMPKTLHRQLIERAEVEGVSANQLAVALLAKGL